MNVCCPHLILVEADTYCVIIDRYAPTPKGYIKGRNKSAGS